MAQERLQKLLARAGIDSRRKVEDLIRLGEVTVNGKVAKVGDKAEWGKDAIKVSGKLIVAREAKVYLLFNKPPKVVSSLLDPEGRPTISGYLARVKERVFPVGSLDFMTEGLILLTNDGDFAERLQKASGVLRVYHVKVGGHLQNTDLESLRRGGRVEGRLITPKSVRAVEHFSKKGLIEIVMDGPTSSDLKAFLENRSFKVARITRVGLGHLRLKELRPGEFRELKESQVEALLVQPYLAERLLDQESKKTKLKEKEIGEDDSVGGRAPRAERVKEPGERSSRPERSGEKLGRSDRGVVRSAERPSRLGGGASRPSRQGARPSRPDSRKSPMRVKRRT